MLRTVILGQLGSTQPARLATAEKYSKLENFPNGSEPTVELENPGVRIPLLPPRSLERRETWLHSPQDRSKCPQFRESCSHTGLENVTRLSSQASFEARFSEGPRTWPFPGAVR